MASGDRGAQWRAWLVVAMLFLFMVINFADKAVLGLSAGPIMRELRLSHTQFGGVGTSFFAFFSIGAVLFGFLANRLPTRWMLAAMVLVWSLCQVPMAFAATASALIANRVLLGLGEGPAYPIALHSAFKWFPNERRPTPTSLIAIGGAVGAGIVAPGISLVIAEWSWHAAFGLLGVVGFVWCAVWLTIAREGPLAVANPSTCPECEPRVPYRQLLSLPTVVGAQLVGFSAYGLLTLMVVWLPAYLAEGFGYSPSAIGWLVALPALCQIALVPAICTLSETLKQHGVSSRVARGAVASGSVVAAGLLTIMLPLGSGTVLPIVCMTVAFSIGNVIFVLGHVAVAEVTPVGQRGAMLGITNAVMTLAGPLAPITMGMIVDVGTDPADGFRTGFILAGVLVMAGGLAGLLLLNPEADRGRLHSVRAQRPRAGAPRSSA